jgi:hypothetical protein
MFGAIIGITPDQIKTSTQGAEFRKGTIGGWDDPDNGFKAYMYVEAKEAITALGYLCVVDTDFKVEMVDTTSSAPGAGAGRPCGAAQAAIASGGFGWIQIYGEGSVRTLASAALGTELTSSATPGAVDDATTAGLEVINGLSLGTASGGSAETNGDAFFNFPYVGRTL